MSGLKVATQASLYKKTDMVQHMILAMKFTAIMIIPLAISNSVL